MTTSTGAGAAMLHAMTAWYEHVPHPSLEQRPPAGPVNRVLAIMDKVTAHGGDIQRYSHRVAHQSSARRSRRQ